MGLEMQVQSNGSGEPLALIGGGLTGWLSWAPHAGVLAKTRRVIRLQLLSVQYGLEDRPLPPDYSIKTESGALAAALDGLGLRAPVDIVAWSYGAFATLDFALDHPGRVKSLTLIEPPAVWLLRATGGLDEAAEEVMATLARYKGEISEDDLERFLCSVGLCPPGQPVRQHPQWPVWVQHRRSLRNSSAVVDHKDQPSRLRNIRCPVLLVKGTGSAPFLHQVIDRLAAAVPQAEVVEIPPGHAPQIVSMDRFLERLTAFLSHARK